MTAGRCSRTVRAAVFAAVCVLLAALGHVLMSGDRVPWWALGAGAAATGAAGWGLAGRERGLPLIVTVVVAAQTALHTAFSLAHPAARAAGPAGTHAHADMDMGMGAAHGHVPHAPDLMGYTGAVAEGGGPSSYGMPAAHLLAALLCGLWLAHGERAAFRVLRAFAGRLAAPLRMLFAVVPAAPERPRARVRRRGTDRAPRLLLLVHAITSRGPPAGTAVA
ncbi:hypothetical protein P1P75_07090 [Streptomyces sp. ID05-39B]|uniref:hypothetical protein n=1 Tax=Streptomyces sp. ID05-39B TaxID=3028664 RepID=UPI0029B60A88|nr:hypothetical protein [Streptomyces sp. ID05-39B]MDX3526206.1 hypothetical protein [Streptomyces sp. ID05-39B]